MNSIDQELNNFTFYRDRTGNLAPQNEIILPLNLSQCLINSDNNYQATADTFNNALSCIYINYMYLYSKCFLVDNNYPTNNPLYIGNFTTDQISVLSVRDINWTYVNTLTAITSSIDFTVNHFVNTYSITIPISSTSTPLSITTSIRDNLTSIGDGKVFFASSIQSQAVNIPPPDGSSLSSYSYIVNLSGVPGLLLNNSPTTQSGDIFYTTSTFTTNSAVTYLQTKNNPSTATKFSFASPLSAGMDDLVDMVVGYNNYTQNKVLFCASKTRLYIFTDGINGVQLVYSSDTLGYKRDINFQSIASLVLYGNFLFIGESYYNSVYKVNVSGFLLNDPINSERLIVEKIIGGLGGGAEPTQFNNPEPQFVLENYLYVFDRNNSYIKIYDLNLNFITSTNISSLIKATPIISGVKPFNIGYYKGYYNIYMLSSYVVVNKTITYRFNEIVILDIQTFFPLYNIRISSNNIDEVLTAFKQSPTDPNIVYVTTNTNFYKFFISNFSQVGLFILEKSNNKFIDVLSLDGNDVVYLYQTPGYGLIVKFIETLTYVNLLTNSDFDIYTLDDLFVKPDENQTFIVYNKTFKKLLYNFKKLLSNITLRPNYILQIGSSLNSKIYSGVDYLNNFEYEKLNIIDVKNVYIGENEVFSNSVLNRALGNFYKLLTLGLTTISNNTSIIFSTINLNDNEVDVQDPNTLQNSFVMTEQFDPAVVDTFNCVILTENGDGIAFETTQSPSPTSTLVFVEDSQTLANKRVSFIDNNTQVYSQGLNLPLVTNENLFPTIVTNYLQVLRSTNVVLPSTELTWNINKVPTTPYNNYNLIGKNIYIQPTANTTTIQTLQTAQYDKNLQSYLDIDPSLFVSRKGNLN